MNLNAHRSTTNLNNAHRSTNLNIAHKISGRVADPLFDAVDVAYAKAAWHMAD